MKWVTPIHLVVGTQTGCGLKGVHHRAIHYTSVQEHVTCRRCKAWIRRNLRGV